jgi:hypothetical protein
MPIIPGVTEQQQDAAIGAGAGLLLFGPLGGLAGALIGWFLAGPERAGEIPLQNYNPLTVEQQGAQALADSSAAVQAAVAGASAAGDTNAIAQGATLAVTGGAADIQGADYVPKYSVDEWQDAIAAAMFENASQQVQAQNENNQNENNLGASAKQALAVAQAGLSATGGALGTAGVVAGAVLGLVAKYGTAVIATIGSWLGTTGLSDDQSTALLSAVSLATIGRADLATEIANAPPLGSGPSLSMADQSAIQLAIKNAQAEGLLVGTSWSKQLRDPSAPGGYITVGGAYGVKQAQTAGQNYTQAAAGGQVVGGPTETIAEQNEAEAQNEGTYGPGGPLNPFYQQPE